MIYFHTLLIRNFMSYGNAVTTIQLDAHQSTLITGLNGAGKSSAITDGLCFVLFNKPYRDVTKPQLINSINLKNCVVEVTFTIGDVLYRVVRGMKPTKFEIYCDDVLADQEAAAKDYQEYLEKTILKLNFKTFTQILILSSSAFIPFMKLTPQARREVVEDVLDIGVFSTMNKILKEKVAATKIELSAIDTALALAQTEAKSLNRIITLMTESKSDKIAEINAEIDSIELVIKDLVDKKEEIDDQIRTAYLEFPADVDKKELASCKDDVAFKKRSLKTLNDQVTKIADMETCPTCSQEVGTAHKEKVKSDLQTTIESTTPAILELDKRIETLEQIAEVFANETLAVKELHTASSMAGMKIDGQRVQLATLQKKLTEANVTQSIEVEQEKLQEIAKSALLKVNRKSTLLTEKSIQEVSLVLLKDTGIKAAIVREYLPALNKFINKYLNDFDFFVNFELDDTFSETIKSRGRDEFSYASFSEGEKRRIDISILLAFRQIAAMKNSAKINILVCDEVDGGLDPESLEKYVDMMTTGIGRNTWVVSHVLSNNPLRDAFESFLKVKKVGDFTTIEKFEDFTVQ